MAKNSFCMLNKYYLYYAHIKFILYILSVLVSTIGQYYWSVLLVSTTGQFVLHILYILYIICITYAMQCIVFTCTLLCNLYMCSQTDGLRTVCERPLIKTFDNNKFIFYTLERWKAIFHFFFHSLRKSSSRTVLVELD